MKFELENKGFAKTHLTHIPSDDELLVIAKSFGSELLHWEFGPIMKMGFDQEAKNYLFSAEEVPFHWDGAFFKEPRFLMFFCDESNGVGGETLFTDTTKMLQDFDVNELRSVRMNFKTEKLAHYGGEIDVPLLQTHPITNKPILRFAEAVSSQKNPVTLSMSGHAPDLYERLKTSAYRHTFEQTWQTGELIIVDNFRFIHGRRALNTNLSRRFRRIQIM